MYLDRQLWQKLDVAMPKPLCHHSFLFRDDAGYLYGGKVYPFVALMF